MVLLTSFVSNHSFRPLRTGGFHRRGPPLIPGGYDFDFEPFEPFLTRYLHKSYGRRAACLAIPRTKVRGGLPQALWWLTHPLASNSPSSVRT